MPIKIAYDISNLGADFNRYDAKHGINRVVDEVLRELCNRDDVEITAVALDGTDLLNDNIKALLYLENRKPPLNCEFNYTFYPGPRLTKAYKAVFQATESGTLSLRYLRAALYRMAHHRRVTSAKPVFDRN